MIRFVLVLLIIYVTYVFYRKNSNIQTGSKLSETSKDKSFPKSFCPTPKDFIDYAEGRIKGKKKETLDEHITHCKNCRDALHCMYDMSEG